MPGLGTESNGVRPFVAPEGPPSDRLDRVLAIVASLRPGTTWSASLRRRALHRGVGPCPSGTAVGTVESWNAADALFSFEQLRSDPADAALQEIPQAHPLRHRARGRACCGCEPACRELSAKMALTCCGSYPVSLLWAGGPQDDDDVAADRVDEDLMRIRVRIRRCRWT